MSYERWVLKTEILPSSYFKSSIIEENEAPNDINHLTPPTP